MRAADGGAKATLCMAGRVAYLARCRRRTPRDTTLKNTVMRRFADRAHTANSDSEFRHAACRHVASVRSFFTARGPRGQNCNRCRHEPTAARRAVLQYCAPHMKPDSFSITAL